MRRAMEEEEEEELEHVDLFSKFFCFLFNFLT